jgi:hypothetical protein
MVQAMEAWFHADKEKVQEYFGQGFPTRVAEVNERISRAFRKPIYLTACRWLREIAWKGEYSKGQHSFEILALIDPAKVRAASPHAGRLLNVLDRICGR